MHFDLLRGEIHGLLERTVLKDNFDECILWVIQTGRGRNFCEGEKG